MNRLMSLAAARNRVSDTTPVTRLPWLRFLDLSDNRISDLSPLQEAYSLFGGGALLLDGNPLDHKDLPDIEALEAQRIKVRQTIIDIDDF